MTRPRLTRLHVLGLCFLLAVGAMMFMRRGGDEAADAVELPTLVDDVDDDTEQPDDGDGDEAEDSDAADDEEPGPLALDLEDLDDSSKSTDGELLGDGELLDAGDEPIASGINPLTGEIDGSVDADLNDEEMTIGADLSGDIGTGEGDGLSGDPDIIIDSGLADSGLGDSDLSDIGSGDSDLPDGRDESIVVGGPDVIVVGDGDDRPDGPVAFVDDDNGRNDDVIIVDGDLGGRDDRVIVVDGDGNGDRNGIDTGGDRVVIIEDNDRDDRDIPQEIPVIVDDSLAVDVDVPALVPDAEPEPAPEPPKTMAEAANIAAAESLLDEWLSAKDVAGARIGLSFKDGSTAFLVGGAENDGSEIRADGEFLATSITKTMTASIIFDLISEGVLELDQLAPELAAFPEFGHSGKMTIRQLLQHTSGLAPYQRSPEWSQDMAITPVLALDLADDIPLEFTPGAERGYSNSGYIYLGMLAEQLTGTPYNELVNNRIVEPFDLRVTRLDDTPRAGWVGYSAGGAVSSVPDLLRWGAALYRDRRVLEPEQIGAMLDVNNEHSTGLGANVICPCGLDNGRLWYTSIGHDGGSVTLQHSPADGLVVAGKFTESFWTDDLSQVEVHALLRQIRAIAAPA